MEKDIISDALVDHIAHLARVPVTLSEEHTLAQDFNAALAVVDDLFKVEVSNVEPIHQVTGLKNVLREDLVEQGRMLAQEQALANAPAQYDGYFMVGRVLNIEF